MDEFPANEQFVKFKVLESPETAPPAYEELLLENRQFVSVHVPFIIAMAPPVLCATELLEKVQFASVDVPELLKIAPPLWAALLLENMQFIRVTLPS